MENILKDLTKYRMKVEKDGKEIVNVPGILCLPGLFAAPRMGLIGMVAAPLLGCSIHLESENGKEESVEETVQNAAETVIDTAKATVKAIREEIEKAWESVSADDLEEEKETDLPTDGDAAEEPADVPAEEPEVHEAGSVPTIQVNPEDSFKA